MGKISQKKHILIYHIKMSLDDLTDFELDYYKERFESGTTDWNTILVFFAESPENVNLVAPQIKDGIWIPF